MSDATTKHARFFPWAHAPLGLKLSIQAARYDFDRDATVHRDRHLVEADEPFDRLDLQIEVDLPALTRARVIPSDELNSLSVVIGIRCDSTRSRVGITLPVGGAESVMHRLTLSRGDVSGSVEISAHLIRSQRSTRPAEGFATARGAILADARPWEIRIDRQRAIAGVFLDVRYRSFRDDPVVPASDKQNLYRLELDGDVPTLWLNSDLPAAVGVLDSRAQSGGQAALREVAFDLVTPSVWTQLAFHSIPRVAELGSDAPEWERAVVERIGQLLYGKVSFEVATDRLREALREPVTLLGRLDAALQRQHELGRHLERLSEDG